jgi:hypothetical protein
MVELLRTELLKLTTIKAPLAIALGSAGLTLALALNSVLKAGRGGTPSIGTAGAALGVLEAMNRGSLLALIAGVLVVVLEYRHQTITGTLLEFPNRFQLATAKALAGLVVGLALGLVSLLIVVVVGTASGALRTNLVNPDIVLRGAGLLLTYPAYAVIGVAVGMLLAHYHSLAVLLPVAWVLVIEALLVSRLPKQAMGWTLGGTTAALQNSGTVPRLLPVWLGGCVLATYVVVLLAAGTGRLVREDVT